jgi:hypothetical protein
LIDVVFTKPDGYPDYKLFYNFATKRIKKDTSKPIIKQQPRFKSSSKGKGWFGKPLEHAEAARKG